MSRKCGLVTLTDLAEIFEQFCILVLPNESRSIDGNSKKFRHRIGNAKMGLSVDEMHPHRTYHGLVPVSTSQIEQRSNFESEPIRREGFDRETVPNTTEHANARNGTTHISAFADTPLNQQARCLMCVRH